jgi:hypothetical protein
MNSTQNKSALWKSCIEQGLFDKVPPNMQYQVQGLFELTINQFNNEGLDIAMANQLLLKEFKLQLGKMIGQSIPQKSFEQFNEEYTGQYQAKIPEKIEFSKEKDKPIEDLEEILKLKSQQRQNEIHEFFREDQKIGGVLEEPFKELAEPKFESMIETTVPPKIEKIVEKNSSTITKEELNLHRRILQSILESQLKIIELLDKK